MRRFLLIALALPVTALTSLPPAQAADFLAVWSEFQRNEGAFQQRYRGQTLSVTGTIYMIDTQVTPASVVVGDRRGSIWCHTSDKATALGLSVGQGATVSGVFTRANVSGIHLDRCSVQSSAGGARAADPVAAQTGSSLKTGEYTCFGSGGRPLLGAGFKVLAGGRYTDLEGGSSGTFSVNGNQVTFRGGHLDGQIGRDLKGDTFRIGTLASCEPS
jgi:hypothetical protein